jgi:DNA repair exonuclease SbcCD nuclease subunit
VVPHDFTFARDMIPSSVDLAVFGHIHMHQILWDKVVNTGAPERIDWGERLDPKGFVTIQADGTWSFVELAARPMEKVEVTAALGDDVTQRVLEALPGDVSGKLVRIEVWLPDELRSSLDERKLRAKLESAFHVELRLVSTERIRTTTDEFTMDPMRLLAEYVDKTLEGHPRKETIKAEAQRLLKEALA